MFFLVGGLKIPFSRYLVPNRSLSLLRLSVRMGKDRLIAVWLMIRMVNLVVVKVRLFRQL